MADVDYDALAKKFGAVESAEPDYDALAAQFGAIDAPQERRAIPEIQDRDVPGSWRREVQDFMDKSGNMRSAIERLKRPIELTVRSGLEAFGAGGPLGGLAQPETPTERVGSETAKAMAQGLGVSRLGGALRDYAVNPVVKGIGGLLAERQLANTILAGASGAGSSTSKELGGSEFDQMLAGVAAPVGVSLATSAVRPVVQGAGKIIHSSLAPSGAKQAAGRVLVDTAGDTAPQTLREVATGHSGLTAGQAATNVSKSEFQGLEREVGRKFAPSEFGKKGGTIQKALEAQLKNEESALFQRLEPARERVLSALEQRGKIDTQPLTKNFDALLRDPDFGNSDAVKGVVGKVTRMLSDRAKTGQFDEVSGGVDAKVLYGIRKNLSKEWPSIARKEGYDSAASKKALRAATQAIDEAILSAEQRALGTQTWRTEYMDPMAKGLKNIDQVNDMVKAAAVKGSEGASSTRKVAGIGEGGDVTLGNFLNRTVMALNMLLKNAQGSGREKTMKELSRLMRPENKGELSVLMAEELARRNAKEGWKQGVLRGTAVGSATELAP
jgi:hypothetical protein